MPSPTTTPVTTPVTTPGPSEQPLWETYTDPTEICPQQRREGASPDVEP